MTTDIRSSQPGTGESRSEPPRVKTVACLGGVSLERGIATEEISEYIRDADNLVWIDVQDPGPEEIAMLMGEFGFHPLALEDVSKGQQRPKVDEYKGYMFVVTYAVVPANLPTEPGPGEVSVAQRESAEQQVDAAGRESNRELRTVEVDLFIGRNYVVTLHRGRVPALEDAYGRWTRGGPMLREGVGFLVYTVMDSIIDAYFPIIDRIENDVEDIEAEMFTRLRPEGIQVLLKTKRTLVTLRRVLYPLRETFNIFLRREQPIFSPNTLVYFHDVHDHILRLLDVLDIERDMVTGALEAHLTVLSNRLNMTMKTLSVVTMVVAIAGLTFGAWGMNFDAIPLSHSPWGFTIVVAGTMGLIAAVLAFAWKRGWL